MTPCGLKNIGNTCYFNSLIQIYFNLPLFVEEIMRFNPDEKFSLADIPERQRADIEKKVNANKKLIKELQVLFANMALSDKKYADPSKVMNSIMDDSGNPV
jgi:ubiquitin carboxyl-terminal hydrolase 25/28